MTTTIYPSKDSYVRQDNPTTNYGTSTVLLVETDKSKVSFIDFDVSSVDEYTYVSSDMSLRPVYNNTKHKLYYALIQSTWTETGITWNNQPTYSSVHLGSVTHDGTTGVPLTIIDTTQYVNGIISDGDTYYGYVFDDVDIITGTGTTASIRSSEYTSEKPFVTITTHEDEGYDSSKSISASLLGVYTYGNGRCDMDNYNISNNTAYCAFRLPWSDTWESYKTYNVDDFDTYTNVETTYTEYFTTEFTGLFFDGEIYNAVFSIHWFRRYDEVYVTTSGDNSNTGTSWTDAYRTITKGFDSVLLNGTVNVEGGTYTGESSFDIVRDCDMGLRSGYGDVTLNIN
jgi:hypothetical protein